MLRALPSLSPLHQKQNVLLPVLWHSPFPHWCNILRGPTLGILLWRDIHCLISKQQAELFHRYFFVWSLVRGFHPLWAPISFFFSLVLITWIFPGLASIHLEYSSLCWILARERKVLAGSVLLAEWGDLQHLHLLKSSAARANLQSPGKLQMTGFQKLKHATLA